MNNAIDWDALTREAIRVRQNAYAPYSGFPVGAAILSTHGVIVSGCNVENASSGLTLCAECGAVSSLQAQQAGLIQAIVVLDKNDNLLSPCGRCRQILLEHSAEDAVICLDAGVISLTDLMPYPFDKTALSRN